MKVYVYGLAEISGDVTEIRYIGMTDDLKSRLSQHRNDKDFTKKCKWISDVKRSNNQIKMIILGEADSRKSAHALENSWIKFSEKRGWDLVNGTKQSDWRDSFSGDFDASVEIEMLKADTDERISRATAILDATIERHQKEIDNIKRMHQQEIDSILNSNSLKIEGILNSHSVEVESLISEANQKLHNEKSAMSKEFSERIESINHSARTVYTMAVLILGTLYTILVPSLIVLSMDHDHSLLYVPVEILAWSTYGWVPAAILLCFPLHKVPMPKELSAASVLDALFEAYRLSESRYVINQMAIRVVGAIVLTALIYITS